MSSSNVMIASSMLSFVSCNVVGILPCAFTSLSASVITCSDFLMALYFFVILDWASHYWYVF
jgi:hypothetical protein